MPIWKLWQVQKHIFKKNVAYNLLPEETTVNDLMCVFLFCFSGLRKLS